MVGPITTKVAEYSMCFQFLSLPHCFFAHFLEEKNNHHNQVKRRGRKKSKSLQGDLNSRSFGYKPNALPAKLCRHMLQKQRLGKNMYSCFMTHPRKVRFFFTSIFIPRKKEEEEKHVPCICTKPHNSLPMTRIPLFPSFVFHTKKMRHNSCTAPLNHFFRSKSS
jgi:hypothetical protein